MKRIILFFLLSVVANVAVAQSKRTLTGTVKSQEGEPLAAATITINEFKNIWAESDIDGEFKLHLVPGDYTLTISLVGYQQLTEKVSINENSRIEIILAEQAERIDAVTVTGKSKAQLIKESAFAASAFNIKPIVSSVHNINNVLGRTTGIKIREEGGVGSNFELSINGMSGNSVRYFLDGVPLDSKGSGVTLANLPVNIIERVEIYKGVIPASLGADALGGAINIITNGAKKNFFDISYGYGSFGTHKSELYAQVIAPKTGIIIKPVVSASYSKNNYVMHDVEVPNEDRTRFITGDFERFHDDYLSLYGELEAGVSGKKWADAFFIGGSFSKIDKELQTGSVQDKVYGMAQRNTESAGISVRYSKTDLFTEGFDLNVSASYTWDHSQTIDTTYRKYYWDGRYIEGSRNEITGRARSWRHYKRPLFIARTNLNYAIADGHSLNLNYLLNRSGNNQYDQVDETYEPSDDVVARHIVGLSYNQSLFDSKMENIFFIKDYINHLEVGQTELGSITGSQKFNGSATKSYMGYGVGLKYTFAEPAVVKLSYEHSVRLPLSRELLGNGSTVYPNLTLSPENSENFNLGLFGNWQATTESHFYYEANGFVRLVDDYIQAKVSEKEGMMQYENVPAVHIKGIEGELTYTWNNKLQLKGNFSYQDSRDQRKYKDDGKLSATYRNRTPNKPWVFWNAEASYSFDDLITKDSKLKLFYSYQWVHWFYLTWEAYGSNATKARIPTQSISNISALYEWCGGKYNIFLECNNLFDAMAYDNYKLQKPGRSFFVKFRLFID